MMLKPNAQLKALLPSASDSYSASGTNEQMSGRCKKIIVSLVLIISTGGACRTKTECKPIDPSCNALSWILSTRTDTIRTLYVISTTPATTVTTYVAHSVTGQLTPLSNAVTGNTPTFQVMHPNGSFSYVSNGAATLGITPYRVGSSGSLTSLGLFATGNQNTGIAFHPNGRFLFMANGGNGDILQYIVDTTTGLITANGNVAGVGNSNTVVTDRAGNYLYSADSASGQVDILSISSSGTLTNITSVSAPNFPLSIALHPFGQFIYTTNNTTGVLPFTIQSTGLLSPNGAAGTCGTTNTSIAFDPTGSQLYTVASGSGQLCMFYVANDGQLTPGFTTIVGSGPNFVYMHPTGKYIYITDGVDNTLKIFPRSTSSGAIGTPTTLSVAAAPKAITAFTVSDF